MSRFVPRRVSAGLCLVVALSLSLVSVPPLTADDDPSAHRLDEAKTSLVQLAAWFESLPPAERAAAARELRRWLEATYGSERPFPFTLPGEEEIAAWEAVAASEDVTASEGVTASGVITESPPVAESPRPRSRCNTLTLFDTDGDGVLTGLDRYWRHLYLWFDSDGDRNPVPEEMVPPFERDIREIALDLRTFVAGRGKKAGRGEIEIEEYLLFDTDIDGWSATIYPTRDDAALAVDADALRRDPQGLDLRDAAGAEVQGIQPIVAGWTITDATGRTVVVDCPG